MAIRENSKKKSRKPVERAAPEARRLTLDQAAIEVPCCRKTLEKYVVLKQLRVMRLGRKILVPRDALEEFLRRKAVR